MSRSSRRHRFARFIVATLNIASVFVAMVASATPADTLTNRLEAFLDAHFVKNPDLGLDDTIRLIESEYQRQLPQQDASTFHNASDARLTELFDAAWFVAAFSLEPGHVARVDATFAEMARRGIASPEQSSKMLDILFGARLQSQAHTFARRHAANRASALPTIHDEVAPSATRTLLDLSDPTGTLHRHAFMLQQVQLIVVAHPSCGFTRAAARDLAADPRIAAMLETHATWIVPPSPGFVFDPIRTWNRENPDRRMRVVYRRSEWEMIDLGGVPQFYFLKDGTVVHHVRGWRDNSQLAEIAEGFERLGIALSPPSTRTRDD